jgi:hypothetical protein
VTRLFGWVVPDSSLLLTEVTSDSDDPLERYRLLLWSLAALVAEADCYEDAARLAKILHRFDMGAGKLLDK